MNPEFDSRDAEIVKTRVAKLNLVTSPRVGDFVRFLGGTTRRISYIWHDTLIQTSDEGRFYLDDGFVDFGGALFGSVPGKTLTLTNEKRIGRVWLFHHDEARAHNGVDSYVEFRVYESSVMAPT